MFASHLPRTVKLTRSSDMGVIANALAEALDGCLSLGYAHMDPIRGTSRSGRVLSPLPCGNSVPFPGPLFPEEMADELMQLTAEEARYDPPENPSGFKGWEISSAMIDGNPVAIVWTAWV